MRLLIAIGQVCSDKQPVWLNIVIFWNYFVHISYKK